MSAFRAVCIGEVLWDCIGVSEYLGGAPFNVAAHLAQLGVCPYLVSGVGADPRGDRALKQLTALGIDRSFVHVSDRPTGTAVVHPDSEEGDRFTLSDNAAYDDPAFSDISCSLLAALRPDAAVFGTLAMKRSRAVFSALHRILDVLPHAEVLYDVNFRQQLYDDETVASALHRCRIVKMNEEEADTLSLLLFDDYMPPDRLARFLLSEFPLHTVLVTRGAQGAAAYPREGDPLDAPGIVSAVSDTVGAGDAFTAAYLHAWLTHRDVARALDAGNRRGAQTVAHPGAVKIN